MSLLTTINDLYEGLPQEEGAPPIRPFVGRDYGLSRPDALRVLVLGINCYYTGPESELTPDTDFPLWFRRRRYSFFARAFSEASVVGEALEQSAVFEGRRWSGIEGLYGTNLVRRYLPKASGRYSKDVAERLLDEGAEHWGRELDLLHRHGVLPHAIVAFGWRIWPRAAAPLRARVGGWVKDYRPCQRSSDLYHHLNRVEIEEGGKTRPLLLMRLNHPASVGAGKRAGWLVEHEEFRDVLHGADGLGSV